MIAANRIHGIQVIPVILLGILSAWHIYSYLSADSLGSHLFHAGTLAVAFALALTSLFLRNPESEPARYAESIVMPIRNHLTGAACIILGGAHLVTTPAEPVFVKMGFLVLLLAFFETAGTANRFLPALAGEPADVTRETLKRLLLSQLGMLATVFVLSTVLLYLSLMVVVGFSETWTVALLVAILLAAMAFITVIRRI